MSDSNYKPDGTGVVMGDSKPMPDRGSDTGFTGLPTDDGGRDTGPEAINRLGSLSGTDSDPMAQDRARDAHVSWGGHDPEIGQRLTGTGSDPVDDCYPDDPAVPAHGGNGGY